MKKIFAITIFGLVIACTPNKKVETTVLQPKEKPVYKEELQAPENTSMFNPNNVGKLDTNFKLVFHYSKDLEKLNMTLHDSLSKWCSQKSYDFHTFQTDESAGAIPFGSHYFFDLSPFLAASSEGFVIIANGNCINYPVENQLQLDSAWLEINN